MSAFGSPTFESAVCNFGSTISGAASTFEEAGISSTTVDSFLDPTAPLVGAVRADAVAVVVVAVTFWVLSDIEDCSLVVALDSFLEPLTDLEGLAPEERFLPASSPQLVTGVLNEGEEELDRLVVETLPETLPLVALTLTVSLLRLEDSNLITESLTLVSVTGCGGFFGALLGCSSCVIFWRSCTQVETGFIVTVQAFFVETLIRVRV